MSEKQNQSRIVDMLHNQDKVLKESLDLYNGGTLDFLDDDLHGEVIDILSTEVTETTTKKSSADKALKVIVGGVYEGIHKEWEADISQDDLKRFGSSNIDLSRLHKMDFTTVIITAKKPRFTSYKNKSINFTPKIIDLSARDADAVLAEIDKKLLAGKQNEINLLEIIYLPLYGSKTGKNTTELFNIAIKLTPNVAKEKSKQQKLQDLLILITSTFIDDADFKKVLEANMRVLEDSTAVRVIGDWSRNQTLIEVAKNMLRRGRNIQEVVEDTGLDISRVSDLQKELQSHAV